MDLQEVEPTVLILQEVAHETVQRTFIFGIDVHLSEDLVNRINCIDSVRV